MAGQRPSGLNASNCRGAHFVDRILRGEKPSDMSIEQATRFELVINRNTVRALGIKVPLSILLRADRMIE